MNELFTAKDINDIHVQGLSLTQVQEQITTLTQGFPFISLAEPCTPGHGITTIPAPQGEHFIRLYERTETTRAIMKFVPASGAASRMFHPLSVLHHRYHWLDEVTLQSSINRNKPEYEFAKLFIHSLRKFAFAPALQQAMAQHGLQFDDLYAQGHYHDILDYLLTSQGLNYASQPKGLILFHAYPDGPRTAFEEQLVEAAAYTRSRVHFTVPAAFQTAIEQFLKEQQYRYQHPVHPFDITLSIQHPSTDTIAVDLQNKPFRTQYGDLLFRPAGHGALLENIQQLNGDIIFIKNIDNIVPDHLKPETYRYKKILGGYLFELQQTIFQYLRTFDKHEGGPELISQARKFAKQKLSITIPTTFDHLPREEQRRWLFARFNRPLRVCGMVKNQGEPGGGPFWVNMPDGSRSLQIVEKSQIDLDSDEQRAILNESTHFNPVDLVCGVRDYQGKPFHLPDFVNRDTGFIALKTHDGQKLKALERPGLWNGSMAYWNTVFVEVPLLTFNPVKTVNDLLRQEHQPPESLLGVTKQKTYAPQAML